MLCSRNHLQKIGLGWCYKTGDAVIVDEWAKEESVLIASNVPVMSNSREDVNREGTRIGET